MSEKLQVGDGKFEAKVVEKILATLKFAPSFNFHVLFRAKQSVDLHLWRLTGFTVINQKKVSSHNKKLTLFVEEELFPER